MSDTGLLLSHAFRENELAPEEIHGIKSGKRIRYASLRKFSAKFLDYVDRPLVFHMKDVKHDGEWVQLPIYMASCL